MRWWFARRVCQPADVPPAGSGGHEDKPFKDFESFAWHACWGALLARGYRNGGTMISGCFFWLCPFLWRSSTSVFFWIATPPLVFVNTHTTLQMLHFSDPSSCVSTQLVQQKLHDHLTEGHAVIVVDACRVGDDQPDTYTVGKGLFTQRPSRPRLLHPSYTHTRRCAPGFGLKYRYLARSASTHLPLVVGVPQAVSRDAPAADWRVAIVGTTTV